MIVSPKTVAKLIREAHESGALVRFLPDGTVEVEPRKKDATEQTIAVDLVEWKK